MPTWVLNWSSKRQPGDAKPSPPKTKKGLVPRGAATQPGVELNPWWVVEPWAFNRCQPVGRGGGVGGWAIPSAPCRGVTRHDRADGDL